MFKKNLTKKINFKINLFSFTITVAHYHYEPHHTYFTLFLSSFSFRIREPTVLKRYSFSFSLEEEE